jgi:hypothetical protein
VLLPESQVGVEGTDHPRHRGVEIVLFGERDPVALSDLIVQVLIGHGDAHDRDDALLERPGVRDLLVAIVRGQRGWRDDEEERVRCFDGAADGLGKHLGVGDALGVDPGRLPLFLERAG